MKIRILNYMKNITEEEETKAIKVTPTITVVVIEEDFLSLITTITTNKSKQILKLIREHKLIGRR